MISTPPTDRGRRVSGLVLAFGRRGRGRCGWSGIVTLRFRHQSKLHRQGNTRGLANRVGHWFPAAVV
jgi:hypothetical protein